MTSYARAGAPGSPGPAPTIAADSDCAANFDRVYRRHAPRCLGIALRVTRDRQHAQDAVQEAFLAFSRDSDRFDPARGSLGAWLAMLTHRRAVDLVRREHARPRPSCGPQSADHFPAAAEDPEESVASSMRADEVHDVLRALDDNKRQIIYLAYYLGYTQTQIAAATGLPLGTVKTRNRDALRQLRGQLDARAS